MRKRFIILFFVMSALFFIMCGQNSVNGVLNEQVTFALNDSKQLSGELFYPSEEGVFPVLIIAPEKSNKNEIWNDFARKISIKKVRVLVLGADAGSHDDQQNNLVMLSQKITAAITYLHNEKEIPVQKMALLGDGIGGLAAIQTAIQDSLISAAIVMDPPASHKDVDISQLYRQLNGRPFLLIASQKDTKSPSEKIQQYFDAAKDPKKIVWLASDKRGAELLATDMEPIIRRTCLMHVDRFVRNKK